MDVNNVSTNMKDEDFIARGYKKWEKSAVDSEWVEYLYQKGFSDDKGVKYYITAKKWNIHSDVLSRGYYGFECDCQLYKKGTRNALDLTFHVDWTLDEVERYVETIFNTGLFDYYD